LKGLRGKEEAGTLDKRDPFGIPGIAAGFILASHSVDRVPGPPPGVPAGGSPVDRAGVSAAFEETNVVRPEEPDIDFDTSPEYLNRELSWLAFARRVLALVERADLPLLERLKFAGILGTLHDEFVMKRLSGMKRRLARGSTKVGRDGRTPEELARACREELVDQEELLARVISGELRPALAGVGAPIRDHGDLTADERAALRESFSRTIQPILTPLAVDAEHPFPFISSLNLNLAVLLAGESGRRDRFVRIKVPNNRPRWMAVPGSGGFTPIEQVIAANLDLMFPGSEGRHVYAFRVTRGAEGSDEVEADLSMEEALREPGSIVRLVSSELKARKFAGVVRIQVGKDMPEELRGWLATQLGVGPEDIFEAAPFVGLADLLAFTGPDRPGLTFPAHEPVTPPRLRHLEPASTGAIFEEIARGDILLHHPYHSFDTSVIRFLRSAALDPQVLAIKLTIYRTSRDSPTVQALADAARAGKQVAVLVEITARFDEAPNIAWGHFLEQEGVHVSYGVERLKTHVKLALVVREEAGVVRRYAHVGTGNYHSGTARIYEDLGILTAEPEVCEDVAAIFNALTGSTPHGTYRRMLVAPVTMRQRFLDLIRREADHAREGRPTGICAKMNQLQDFEIIRELYEASRAGVPVSLIIRGLSCLRPGVPGQSETIRVFSVVGRFLEHSRIYRFENGGDPEFYVGSADWMKRNLDRRVETIVPVLDAEVRRQLDSILAAYELDNSTAWECRPSGEYVLRAPAEGEPVRAVQEIFLADAFGSAGGRS
jgi:polyphosphate kinase